MTDEETGSYESPDRMHPAHGAVGRLEAAPTNEATRHTVLEASNLCIEDDDEGFVMRQIAYHEAGHLWAAHGLGLPISASDLVDEQVRPTMSPRQAEEYAVAAVVAQAVGREIEFLREYDDVAEIDPLDVDIYHCWEAALDFGDAREFCRHGSDPLAVPFIDPPNATGCPAPKIEPMIDRLLADWRGIDALTSLLLMGKVVTAEQILGCLRPGGPRLLTIA
jgi:hypothetical protein